MILLLFLGVCIMAMGVRSLNPLLARRSVAKFSPAAVNPVIVNRALEAATQAPNHFLTAPWRFYTLGPNAVQTVLSIVPNEKVKLFEKIPNWLVVTMSSEHEFTSKLWLEDHAATACATNNFMMSLAADGVGSKWMTGALGVGPDDMLKAVGASPSEHFMGAIWYGQPDKELSESAKVPKRKLSLDECRTDLP